MGTRLRFWNGQDPGSFRNINTTWPRERERREKPTRENGRIHDAWKVEWSRIQGKKKRNSGHREVGPPSLTQKEEEINSTRASDAHHPHPISGARKLGPTQL